MDYIKNRLFSRKSGLRHLAALLLTFFVLGLTYGIMVLETGDTYWLHAFYARLFRTHGSTMLVGVLGTALGAAALMGGLLRRCCEKWLVRFLQKFFYSLLGAIPIVNLLVPLIYQRRRRKQGRMDFVSDGSFRSSLEGETYRALVTDNIVLKPDGKLKFGIIRFVFVATFRLIGGSILLTLALIVPALTPAAVLAAIGGLSALADYSAEAVFWVGAVAAGLVALIDVLHPLIALLIHPRKKKPAPAAPLPEPEPEADPEPVEDISGVGFVDPVEGNDHAPAPIPDPEEDPQPTAQDSADPLERITDRKDLIEVTERGPEREIENRKEKEL